MWIELPMGYGFILSCTILSHYPTQEVSFRETSVLLQHFSLNISLKIRATFTMQL